MDESDSQGIAIETPADDVFIAPSIIHTAIVGGESYTFHSPIPSRVNNNLSTECVLGIDEAGRGPVLGPMVYGLFYLPLEEHRSLLADKYHFDDSKVLSPEVRSTLVEKLCTTETDLYKNCGWATRVMSARDLSAGMLKPTSNYNLNAQAMDATIQLIQEVFGKGVKVTEIYIDTIGPPATYQKKLERIFPAVKITVAKKADSLYPCVSAASVCAKVTRDAALEVCHRTYAGPNGQSAAQSWGSGYPSDPRSIAWMRANTDPFFGWGSECRFSWSTSKELLESKSSAASVDWEGNGDETAPRLTDYLASKNNDSSRGSSELTNWFGVSATEVVL